MNSSRPRQPRPGSAASAVGKVLLAAVATALAVASFSLRRPAPPTPGAAPLPAPSPGPTSPPPGEPTPAGSPLDTLSAWQASCEQGVTGSRPALLERLADAVGRAEPGSAERDALQQQLAELRDAPADVWPRLFCATQVSLGLLQPPEYLECPDGTKVAAYHLPTRSEFVEGCGLTDTNGLHVVLKPDPGPPVWTLRP